MEPRHAAPEERKAEEQPPVPAQSVEGHGRVLLISELWKEDEDGLSLQSFPGDAVVDQLPGPSSARVMSGHTRADNCTARRPKRSGDSSVNRDDGPATKSKRFTQEPRRCEPKAEDPREAPGAPPGTPDSAAKDTASGRGAPQQPPERGAQLLLVLCRAPALLTQRPRLQLLLQQLRSKDRRPTAALVGIVVQPRRDEEAEARRRMEALLSRVLEPHSPAVEVHTAVFCPDRPEGTLDVQRAASQAHRISLVDRETQTDGEMSTRGGGRPGRRTLKQAALDPDPAAPRGRGQSPKSQQLSWCLLEFWVLLGWRGTRVPPAVLTGAISASECSN
ncbi:hypothetical protein P7K49_013487 [Saguinus oedipus]|uniref:Uncharacterized protein n=1 Tax=Saguinus oedipus TaxID=9490 RepID=A0ABQ9VJ12_SAGOE|nr:hypothetical protein P7K49_013487 [Saguinus oedipus]